MRKALRQPHETERAKENYSEDVSRYLERDLAEAVDAITSGRSGLAGAKDVDEFKQRFRDEWRQQEAILEKIISSQELKKPFLDRIEKIKQYNIELLRQYGFEFNKEI